MIVTYTSVTLFHACLMKSNARYRPTVLRATPPITLYPSCCLTPLSGVRDLFRYLERNLLNKNFIWTRNSPIQQPNFLGTSKSIQNCWLFWSNLTVLVPIPGKVPFLFISIGYCLTVCLILQVDINTEIWIFMRWEKQQASSLKAKKRHLKEPISLDT